jgi:hypothetical protein
MLMHICIGMQCIRAKYIILAAGDNYIKMGDRVIPLNHDALSELLNDPVILRLVTVVNLTSLSILELLEYNFSRKDISRALAKGVIKFDKSSSLPPAPEGTSKEVVYHVLETGDYYFGLLSSKVRLTEVGLYLLETIEAQTARGGPMPKMESELLLEGLEDTSENVPDRSVHPL